MEQPPYTVSMIPHWFSVEDFARASRIQPRAVYLRFRRGAITAKRVDGVVVVDSQLSPPIRQLPKLFKAPGFVQPPDMPPLDRLVQMSAFCKRENIRGHGLYRDILFGKIPAWCFADHVFVEDTPELRQYLTHR